MSWAKIGKHLGYPECCTDHFINVGGAMVNPKGAKAGNRTGFIPCPTCADKVLSGEVELKDLINDREHSSPFPELNIVEINKFINSTK